LLSRDGNLMAFQLEGPGGASEILLRKTDGSPALRVGPGNLLALSPDATKVLALALAPRDLVVYPTAEGEPIVLNRGAIDSYVGIGGWFPGGDRVVTCGSERGRPPRCYEQPLGGAPRAITSEGVIGAALSADGRQLLAQDTAGAWHVVDLTTGAPRAAAGLRPTDTVAGWSADGRAAFATRVPQVPARLERVDLQTGVRTLVRELAPPARVSVIVPTSVIDDARGYAYFYMRDVATWYVVHGTSLSR
jgi:hypothetical protein